MFAQLLLFYLALQLPQVAVDLLGYEFGNQPAAGLAQLEQTRS